MNWRRGHEVLVVSTIWRDLETNQNEVMIVESVSDDGLTIVFSKPLVYKHYGCVD